MKKIEIEFADGKKTKVAELDSKIFNTLQQKYKSSITKVDGKISAFWGMTDDDIKNELKKISVKKNLRNQRVEFIKEHQYDCKHDKGYVTNTGMNPSQCVVCSKPIF